MSSGSERLRDARFTKASAVGIEHARATWALAARERLMEIAREYHGVITEQELADFVQDRSLISTDQQIRYWIGDVLARVARDCQCRGEPNLSSLCVTAEGAVGKGYAGVVEEVQGRPIGDPNELAAQERLECHRHFGARLPPGGGVPAMAPQYVEKPAARRTVRAVSSPTATRTPRSAPEKPLEICPVHFTQLPATGICDDCD